MIDMIDNMELADILLFLSRCTSIEAIEMIEKFQAGELIIDGMSIDDVTDAYIDDTVEVE